MNRAIFLDRDGTVIRDTGYIRDPALIQPLRGALEVLSRLSAQGWRLIVISNQSGVGRGYFSRREMLQVERAFESMMSAAGAPVTASYFCAHSPEERCECRKPSPLLLFQAARLNGIDLRESWMVGDRKSDILSGRNAGCRTIWLRNSVHETPPALSDDAAPDYAADDWAGIERIINDSVRTEIKGNVSNSFEPGVSQEA